MMVIVWVFTPYSKDLSKFFRRRCCLHLQDGNLVQADAEVTVWKECGCCKGRLRVFRAMEWEGGIGLVVSQWELGIPRITKIVMCVVCCCSFNHTSQHLSDGKPSPIPDCWWDQAQSGEGNSSYPLRLSGVSKESAYCMACL